MQHHFLATSSTGGVLTLRRHPSEVRRGRAHVAEACRGYADDFVHTAELLASELITNAVVHGKGPIVVLVHTKPGELRVDVADESPSMPSSRMLDFVAADGRGLPIVELLAHEWGVEPLPQGGGKAVWFVLRAAA